MISQTNIFKRSRIFAGLWAQSVALAGCFLLVSSSHAARFGAPPSGAPSELNEAKLLELLRSDVPAAEKAIACKKLAVCGTKKAVPPLAPLLLDERMSSWARIALEAIPDAAADEALRNAQQKASGRLLVGIINSIGYRRDAKAASALQKRLGEADPEVASAAAAALGRIGGSSSAKVLAKALTTAPAAVQPAVAEACVVCAESFMNQKKSRDATKVYDTVRKANVPKQQMLEATRGAILARGQSGIPLLVEQLRSADKALFGVALRTARELPGSDATQAIIKEMQTCPAERQPLVLAALADRDDAAVMPAVLDAARAGQVATRLTAVKALDNYGKSSSIPVLLKIASDEDGALREAATTALARLSGTAVDAELQAKLAQASGSTRRALIEVAVRRGMSSALPAIASSVQDSDPATRRAAIQAIGALGEKEQLAELVKMLQSATDSKEREAVEAALIAISGRSGAASVAPLLGLAKSGNAEVRIAALHALAAAGGTEALSAIASAAEEKEEALQDEAVRTLSTWPNNWPEDEGAAEPLLKLVKSSDKTSHQVLGLRGYLQYLQTSKKITPQEKGARLADLTSFLKRPEEKRLVISAAEKIQTPDTYGMLAKFMDDSAVAEPAADAILRLADRKGGGGPRVKAARELALKAVAEKSSSAETKTAATKLLNTPE